MTQGEQIIELQTAVNTLKNTVHQQMTYIDALRAMCEDQDEKLEVIEELLELDE